MSEYKPGLMFWLSAVCISIAAIIFIVSGIAKLILAVRGGGGVPCEI